MNRFAKVGLASAVALVASQVWPLDQTNPPRRFEGRILGQASDSRLRDACFACHSNRTVWPWYAKVTPTRFLVTRDVQAGREELNFDDWDLLAGERRVKLLKKSAEEIREGEMPPGSYLLTHPEARMTPAQKEDLAAAFDRESRP